jgi:hypothetical protein
MEKETKEGPEVLVIKRGKNYEKIFQKTPPNTKKKK